MNSILNEFIIVNISNLYLSAILKLITRARNDLKLILIYGLSNQYKS